MRKTILGLNETTIHKCYASDDFYRWDDAPSLFTTTATVGMAAADHSKWKAGSTMGGIWETDAGTLIGRSGTIYYDDARTDYVVSAQVLTATPGAEYDHTGSVVFMFKDKDNFAYTGISVSGKFYVDYVTAGVDGVFYESDCTYDTDVWHEIAVRVSNKAQYTVYLDGEVVFQYSKLDVTTTTYGGLRANQCTAYFSKFATFAYGSEYTDWASVNLTVRDSTESVSTSKIAIPSRWGGSVQSGRPVGKEWVLAGKLIQNFDSPSDGQNVIRQPINKRFTSRARPGVFDTFSIPNGDGSYSAYYNAKLLTYSGVDDQYVHIRIIRGYGDDGDGIIYANTAADFHDIYFTDTNLNEIKYYIRHTDPFHAIVTLVGQTDFTADSQVLFHYGGTADTISHEVSVPVKEMYDASFAGRVVGAWGMDSTVAGGTEIPDRVDTKNAFLFPEPVISMKPPVVSDFSVTKFTKVQFGKYLEFTSDGTISSHSAIHTMPVVGGEDLPLRVTYMCDTDSDAFDVARLYVSDTTGGSAYWDLYFNANQLVTIDAFVDAPEGGSVNLATIDEIEFRFQTAGAATFKVNVYDIAWGMRPVPGAFAYKGTTFSLNRSVSLTHSGPTVTNAPVEFTLHTGNGVSEGNDVYNVVTNFIWNDIIFTDENYNRLTFTRTEATPAYAKFLVWIPTLGETGTQINLHYGGDTGMIFTNVLPVFGADDLDSTVDVAYDMVTTSMDFADISNRAQIDSGDSMSGWSVVSTNSSDVLSIVPSFTGSGSALRLTLSSGTERYVKLMKSGVDLGSSVVDHNWLIEAQSGLPITSVPGYVRVEQGSAWAQWTTDFALDTPTLFNLLILAPDSSSGTIDYSNTVDISFTVLKRPGSPATFDVDEVFVTQVIVVPTAEKLIDLAGISNADGDLYPSGADAPVPGDSPSSKVSGDGMTIYGHKSQYIESTTTPEAVVYDIDIADPPVGPEIPPMPPIPEPPTYSGDTLTVKQIPAQPTPYTYGGTTHTVHATSGTADYTNMADVMTALGNGTIVDDDIIDVQDAQTITSTWTVAKNIRIISTNGGSITQSSSATLITSNNAKLSFEDITLIRASGTGFSSNTIFCSGPLSETLITNCVITNAGEYSVAIGGYISVKNSTMNGAILANDIGTKIYVNNSTIGTERINGIILNANNCVATIDGNSNIYGSGTSLGVISGKTGCVYYIVSGTLHQDLIYNADTVGYYYTGITTSTVVGTGTIYDPCYPTITEAITASSAGDIVQVMDGTYTENPTINKNIKVIGESKDGVIINAVSGTLITGTSGSIHNLTYNLVGTVFYLVTASTGETVWVNNCHLKGSQRGIWVFGTLVMDNVTTKDVSYGKYTLMSSASAKVYLNDFTDINGGQGGTTEATRRSQSISNGNVIYSGELNITNYRNQPIYQTGGNIWFIDVNYTSDKANMITKTGGNTYFKNVNLNAKTIVSSGGNIIADDISTTTITLRDTASLTADTVTAGTITMSNSATIDANTILATTITANDTSTIDAGVIAYTTAAIAPTATTTGRLFPCTQAVRDRAMVDIDTAYRYMAVGKMPPLATVPVVIPPMPEIPTPPTYSGDTLPVKQIPAQPTPYEYNGDTFIVWDYDVPTYTYGGSTLVVQSGGTYTTIQSAIDAASNGDIINVKRNTTVTSAININKSIRLISTEAIAPIIANNTTNTTVEIATGCTVTIENIDIRTKASTGTCLAVSGTCIYKSRYLIASGSYSSDRAVVVNSGGRYVYFGEGAVATLYSATAGVIYSDAADADIYLIGGYLDTGDGDNMTNHVYLGPNHSGNLIMDGFSFGTNNTSKYISINSEDSKAFIFDGNDYSYVNFVGTYSGNTFDAYKNVADCYADMVDGDIMDVQDAQTHAGLFEIKKSIKIIGAGSLSTSGGTSTTYAIEVYSGKTVSLNLNLNSIGRGVLNNGITFIEGGIFTLGGTVGILVNRGTIVVNGGVISNQYGVYTSVLTNTYINGGNISYVVCSGGNTYINNTILNRITIDSGNVFILEQTNDITLTNAGTTYIYNGIDTSGWTITGTGTVVSPCFETITEAITASADGDIVQVMDGLYNENTVIDKSIWLKGQSRDGTIINSTIATRLIENNVPAKVSNISRIVPRTGNSYFLTTAENVIHELYDVYLEGSQSGLRITGTLITDNLIVKNELYGDALFSSTATSLCVMSNFTSINGGQDGTTVATRRSQSISNGNVIYSGELNITNYRNQPIYQTGGNIWFIDVNYTSDKANMITKTGGNTYFKNVNLNAKTIVSSGGNIIADDISTTTITLRDTASLTADTVTAGTITMSDTASIASDDLTCTGTTTLSGTSKIYADTAVLTTTTVGTDCRVSTNRMKVTTLNLSTGGALTSDILKHGTINITGTGNYDCDIRISPTFTRVTRGTYYWMYMGGLDIYDNEVAVLADMDKMPEAVGGSWFTSTWPCCLSCLPIHDGGTIFYGDPFYQKATFSIPGSIGTSDVWAMAILRQLSTDVPIVGNAEVFTMGNMSFALGETSTVAATTDAAIVGSSINDNETHSIGLQFDSGASLKLYLDGISQGSSATADMAISGTGQLGGDTNVAVFFVFYGTGLLTDAEFESLSEQMMMLSVPYSGDTGPYYFIPVADKRANIDDWLRRVGGNSLYVNSVDTRFCGVMKNISYPTDDPRSAMKIADFSITFNEENNNGVD